MKTSLVILVLCTSLLSCSVLPEAEPADIYQLPPSTLTGAATASVLSGLRIATPATADSIGGTRLLAMVGDNSFQGSKQSVAKDVLSLIASNMGQS